MGSQVSTKSKLENWGDTTATMLCVYLWCIAYTTDILPNENVTHKKIIIFNIFLLGALRGGKEVVQSGLKKVFPCTVWWTENYYKIKLAQYPFKCPTSVWLGTRT